MHRAPEGTGREEDEELEVAVWVLRVIMHDQGGVGGSDSSLGNAVVAHTQGDTCGAVGRGVQESRFLQQDHADKTSRLCFPP